MEKRWNEESALAEIRMLINELFPNIGDIQEDVLVLTAHAGRTPVSHILGSVVAKKWPTEDKASKYEAVMRVIVELAQKDFLDLYVDGIIYVESRMELPKRLIKAKRGFIPPLLEEPVTVTHNYMTGYHYQRYGSLILGDANNQHSECISLDVINTQNSIALKINEEFLKKCSPVKPEKMEMSQWIQFQNQCKVLYKELILNGKFFLTNRVDKRGRLYQHGYHINFQGNKFQRSLIDFAESQIVEGTL